jgi:hypothetical protein
MKLKLPKRSTEAKSTETKSTEAKTEATKTETPKLKPVAKGPGLGFFDTFRVGWDVPRMRMAGEKAIIKGESARAAAGGDGKRQVTRKVVSGQAVTRPELAKQRDRLARQFAELQWDLGGIAYEMATRDQFRTEVLVKQAAKLKEVDAELGQVEQVLRLDAEGAAGTCPSCGSLQARGAVYCWQCGKELKPAGKPSQEPKTAEVKKDEGKTAEVKKEAKAS